MALLAPLSEEYHVASRFLGSFKYGPREHLLFYDARIAAMVAASPHHADSPGLLPLPLELDRASRPFAEVVTGRRSRREFPDRSLELGDLGTLLHLGNGVARPGSAQPSGLWRNVPSSGNLGSVEVFPIVLDVTGIEPGLYHYDTVHHGLAPLRAGDFRTWLRTRVLFQVEFSQGAVALVLTSAFGRLKAKYGERGYRLGFIDAGHVSENLQLAAAALGLPACATNGFIDDELDLALGLDGLDVASVLVIVIGARQVPEGEST